MTARKASLSRPPSSVRAEHRHAGVEQAAQGRSGRLLRWLLGREAQLDLVLTDRAPADGGDPPGDQRLDRPGPLLGRDLHDAPAGCGGAPYDLGHRAVGDDPAAVEDDHPVADLLHLGEHVRAQHDV